MPLKRGVQVRTSGASSAREDVRERERVMRRAGSFMRLGEGRAREGRIRVDPGLP
jgi:hypothetical protein